MSLPVTGRLVVDAVEEVKKWRRTMIFLYVESFGSGRSPRTVASKAVIQLLHDTQVFERWAVVGQSVGSVENLYTYGEH